MFVVTKGLVSFLADKHGLDKKHLEESTLVEEEVQEFVVKGLNEGTFTIDEIRDAVNEKKSAGEDRLRSLVKEISGDMEQKVTTTVVETLKQLGVLGGTAPVGGDGSTTTPDGANDPPVGEGMMKKAAGSSGGLEGGAGDVKVKSPFELYDDTRSALTWDRSSNEFMRKAYSGQPIMTGSVVAGDDTPSRVLEEPSQRQKAIAGVWFKSMLIAAARRQGLPDPARWTEHDAAMVKAICNECDFVGPYQMDARDEEAHGYIKGTKIPDHMRDGIMRKALLDDGTSGGLEAVPIEFDNVAIRTPLLTGQLFPLVAVRNVNRRRIEGFTIGNPTFTWTSEGTAIGLFDTTAFVAAFDTNIYPVTSAMEVGLDFEADSPVAIGELVLGVYGPAFAKELDDVIADGNGTSQPLGVFRTSSLPTVSSANGASGPHELSDYEDLLFTVPAEFRQEAGVARSVFISNELSYRRSRQIQVNPTTGDERRLFGLRHESYETLEHPHRLSEELANTNCGFFCMNRYRFYRRQGFATRWVTEDKTLALENKRMLVIRARVGGQMELAAAGAEITDHQS